MMENDRYIVTQSSNISLDVDEDDDDDNSNNENERQSKHEATVLEGLTMVVNLVSSMFSSEKSIDPLFARSIEMGMNDEQLYDCVVAVHNGWVLFNILWILVIMPTFFQIPQYVLQASTKIQTIYYITSGTSVVFGIVALYVGVGAIISLATIPKKSIRLYLHEMGSSVRIPFTFFSMSIIVFFIEICVCFYSIAGSNPYNSVTITTITIGCIGLITAWYCHHTQQDRALLNIHQELANHSPFQRPK